MSAPADRRHDLSARGREVERSDRLLQSYELDMTRALLWSLFVVGYVSPAVEGGDPPIDSGSEQTAVKVSFVQHVRECDPRCDEVRMANTLTVLLRSGVDRSIEVAWIGSSLRGVPLQHWNDPVDLEWWSSGPTRTSSSSSRTG